MLITCPACDFTQNVPDDKIPARSKVATCPQCGQKFQFRELPDEPAPESAQQQYQTPSYHQPDQAPLPGVDTPPQQPESPAHDEQLEQTGHEESQQPPYYGPDGRGLDKPQLEQPLEETQKDEGEDEGMSAAERYLASKGVQSEQQPRTDAYDAPNDENDEQDGMSAAERYLASKGAKEDDQPRMSIPQPEQASGPVQVEVPFEDIENFGFFTGMFHTIKRACFSPRLFFSVMPLRGIIRPIVFGLLITEFMFIMTAFWQLTGIPDFQSMMAEIQGGQAMTPEETLNPVLLFLGIPVAYLFNLLLNSLVAHGVLSIVGGAKRGFEGTVRVMAYSYAPMFLGILPFGIVVGAIWSLALSVIGIKSMHSTDYARSVLAHVVIMLILALLWFGPMLMGMVPPAPPAAG